MQAVFHYYAEFPEEHNIKNFFIKGYVFSYIPFSNLVKEPLWRFWNSTGFMCIQKS